MEQPCYKCGQAVEEGVPFCPHCSAPQIRVVIAELAPAESARREGETAAPDADSAPQIAFAIPWSSAAPACALAAMIAAVLMVLQLVAPLIAVVGAGFLAVAIYRRRTPGYSLRSGTGARLGLLSGFFCFGMTAALGAVRVIVLHEGDQIRHAWLDYLQQTAARFPDPQYQSGLEFMRSPSGVVFTVACLFLFSLAIFLILGALGGALGGGLFSRHDKS